MKIGFIGLGLIGGSIARAVRYFYPDTEIIAHSRHSFAVTYVHLSPEILLFPGFQAFFISVFGHISLDICGYICYNSHSGGAYYAFKKNKNQHRTYLSCNC